MGRADFRSRFGNPLSEWKQVLFTTGPHCGGGVMPPLAPLFPRGPIDVSRWLQALPDDGSVPQMPGWHWIHTPGHTPGSCFDLARVRPHHHRGGRIHHNKSRVRLCGRGAGRRDALTTQVLYSGLECGEIFSATAGRTSTGCGRYRSRAGDARSQDARGFANVGQRLRSNSVPH
jgi:hypothetical protein